MPHHDEPIPDDQHFDHLQPEADTGEPDDAPAAAPIDLPVSTPIAAGPASGIRAEVVAAESPFPVSDSAHKGVFAVHNPTSQPLTMLGYVLELVATVDGQEQVLDTDDSAGHRDPMGGYTHVTNGTFLFFDAKIGLCIEELNLSAMPATVPAGHATNFHFYLHNIDTPATLAAFGLADAAELQARHGRAYLRLTVTLAGAAPLQADYPIELVD